MDERIERQITSKLSHARSFFVRASVRFEDVNGPRGGVDTMCRIKLMLRGRPSLQIEQLGATPREAFTGAVRRLVTSVDRTRGKHALRGNRRPAQPTRATPARARAHDAGSIIGRRVGRGKAARARALARPEKERRDAYVDTAMAGVSASHRRAGGTMTARRNAKANPRRATATLEDSRTKPSRKSTRRSANRAKPSQGKERTALAQAMTPAARRRRHRAR
jgi:hypothetical protein